MTYYILVLWWIGTPVGNRFQEIPKPVMSVHSGEFSVCAEANALTKGNDRARVRIWRMDLKRKNCQATPDPEFINCLVQDGEFTLKEGSCEPRQEFIFR